MTSQQVPDAEKLYAQLRAAVEAALTPATCLLGIHSGGAWIAERLEQDLGLKDRVGSISSSMYRDDYAKRGLAESKPTAIPFAIDGAHIIIIDDVLHTGRTIRAVLNELFDHGRPTKVELMVLVDRGERQLPFASNFAAAQAAFAADTAIHLSKNEAGKLQFTLQAKG